MKVLIIEPTKSIHAILKSVLAPLHVSLKITTSKAQAKQVLERSFKVDAVVMGSVLDDGEAIDFIPELRAMDASRSAPVYLLTSISDREKYSEALGKGITEIFSKSKPLEFAEALVKKISNKRRHQDVAGDILYVEDNESEALAVEAILTDNMFTVEHYDNAEDAIEAFEEKSFDLILCDIFLAGDMTGLAMLRKVRSNDGERKRLPFLAISSDHDTARKVEILSAGANDFASKPVVEEELLARVTNLVMNKQLLDRVNEQQKKLESLAMTDQLTGLYNRNYLFSQVPKNISEAYRHKWDCAVMVADVDKFKTINDTHGHAVGDIVLKAVGKLLQSQFRNEDIVARFGGEEFVVFMPHCNYEQAISKAESVLDSLRALKPNDLMVTASFGVTSLGVSQEAKPTFDDLFKIADAAVYQAKETGRDRVVGTEDLNNKN